MSVNHIITSVTNLLLKKRGNDQKEASWCAMCKNYLWTQDDRRGQVYQL